MSRSDVEERIQSSMSSTIPYTKPNTPEPYEIAPGGPPKASASAVQTLKAALDMKAKHKAPNSQEKPQRPAEGQKRKRTRSRRNKSNNETNNTKSEHIVQPSKTSGTIESNEEIIRLR